jgi:prevent-host-death family protein
MTDISASEARNNFAQYLRRAATGESFTIVREGYPVASLGPPGAFLSPSTDTTIGTAPNYRPEAQTLTTATTSSTDYGYSQVKEQVKPDIPERPSPWETKYGKDQK